ncbi:prolyl oligopeptidase family serine peptidase [Pseudoalteromonas sp. T1lg23B]|uniref:prolyl oligopeptidase family serine peptidase n=1 Tax=Pseudoalteromonas sp. T1lg23B TaxID=2077097 RepID=UPI000CF72C1D|nr:prolyl oligopeptidase family serine peptidase [Pseudoalteromonas sp. T1lg23B]
MKHLMLSAAAIIVLGACSNSTHSPKDTPFTSVQQLKKVEVNETVFGRQISDPYRWMETDDKTLREWMSHAADQTDAALTSLPGYSELYQELLTQSAVGDVANSLSLHGSKVIHLSKKEQDEIAKLYIKDGKHERVLVDPADFKSNPDDNTAIHNYRLSPKGKTLAFHISPNGSEIGQMYFMDVQSGALLDHKLPDIWGEFEVNWIDEDNLFATVMSYVEPSDPLQGMQGVSYHLPSKKLTIEMGPNAQSPSAPQIALNEFPIMSAQPNSEWLMTRTVGARPDGRLLIKKKTSKNWINLAGYDDRIISNTLKDDVLYFVTQKDAPNGKLMKLDLAVSQSLDDAQQIIAHSDLLIHDVLAAKDKLYVQYKENGVHGLYEVNGNQHSIVPLPQKGVLSDLSVDPETGTLSFGLQTPKQPKAYFYYNKGQVSQSEFGKPAVEAPEGFEVIREYALSADGTQVPITIFKSAHSADKVAPAIIYGYGGYGRSLEPYYRNKMFPFLKKGAIWANCHVRGGGEKGRKWHEGGRGKNKPNGHADFIACAEHLVKTGRSKPGMMGAYGGSMAGTLIGPAVLKRPDLFQHAVLRVAILNPLRVLHAQNGANQLGELGDPRTQEGFESIWHMDAYEQLEHVTRYPDIMISVGLNDQRVELWQSGKFAARYVEQGKGDLLIIRANKKGGHGVGSSEQQSAKVYADVYAFMLNRAGHPDFQIN